MKFSSFKYSSLFIILYLLASVQSQDDTDSYEQPQDDYNKGNRVHQEQTRAREAVGLLYNQNTETVTFYINHMADFIVKTIQDEQVKATLHIYWKQQNVYIGSEYRQGEEVRLLIYEDNYRIIVDTKFYITNGFKIQAEKGKVYTIRFIDNGKIQKVLTMQMSKTIPSVENKANKGQIQHITRRLVNIASEVQILSTISQFTVVMHEKSSKEMNHNTCYYMSSLIGESVIILIIVGVQVKTLLKMLSNSGGII